VSAQHQETADKAASAGQHTHSPFAVSMLAAPDAAQAAAAAAQDTAADNSPTDETAAVPARKPAAKRKAPGGARKGQGRKKVSTPAAAPAEAAAEEPQAAPKRGARASRQPSAASAKQKAQQKSDTSGGLTQSKLKFQRTTRSAAAAAAALGVTLSGDTASQHEQPSQVAEAVTAAPAAAAAAAAAKAPKADAPDSADAPPAWITAAEPGPKRHRSTKLTSTQAAASAGAAEVELRPAAGQQKQQADRLAHAPAVPSAHQHTSSMSQQQQQPQVSFSRQKRPSVLGKLAQAASKQAAAPAAAAAGAAINSAFGSQQPSRPRPYSNAPAGVTAVGSVPQKRKDTASGGRSTWAPAAASGAGQKTGRGPGAAVHSSMVLTASGPGEITGKRDRSGQLLTGPPAAAHREPPAGVGVGQRSSVSAAGGAGRQAAATSSAMLLFGDVDELDDASDSLDGVVEGRQALSQDVTAPAAAAAAAATQRASGTAPVTHSLKPAALPRAPAKGAGVRAPGARLPPAPPASAAAVAALPAAAPVAKSGFVLLPSESEPDSDTEHSLDHQQYGHKDQQQQQQFRLVDDDELAQQIAARMARHRIKQHRSVSWQGPAAAGAFSGFSVGNRLH
jgi:hypothetical protein